MFRTSVAIFFLAALSACGPATMQTLRQEPIAKDSFSVNQNYQKAYRTILTNSRKCWQQGMGGGAQMVVTGDLYTDIKTAEITVALHGNLGTTTFLGTDLKAVDDDHTKVDTFAGARSWSPGGPLIKEWLTIGHTDCRTKF